MTYNSYLEQLLMLLLLLPPRCHRALMFDCEIRGQLAMLMGGRAAEQLTCSAVSTGAVDDIRRATDLAYKVCVWGGRHTPCHRPSVQGG